MNIIVLLLPIAKGAAAPTRLLIAGLLNLLLEGLGVVASVVRAVGRGVKRREKKVGGGGGEVLLGRGGNVTLNATIGARVVDVVVDGSSTFSIGVVDFVAFSVWSALLLPTW